MSMSNLQEAFREAARREFALVPTEAELDHVFSRRFERKMNRIIHAQVHGYWNMVNTLGKRIAIVAAIIVMLLTTAMAIKPIRERVIQFFVEVYEDYFEIHFGEEESWDLPEQIEPMVRYNLAGLPEGYIEKVHVKSDHILWTEWENYQGNNITLQQEAGTTEIILNRISTEMEVIDHHGKTIAYQNHEGNQLLIWEHENYIFSLNVYDSLSLDDLLTIINSIQIDK